MTEPGTELRQALKHVGTHWDEARTRRTLAGLGQRRRRRRVALLGAAGAAALSSVALVLLLSPGAGTVMHLGGGESRRGGRAGADTQRARGAAPAEGTADRLARAPQGGQARGATAPLSEPVRQLSLPDGSSVELLDAHARVTVHETSPQRVSLRLDAGHARFQVTRRPERRFRVQAGPVTVEVLGTTFSVWRDVERTRVEVEQGRVVVRVGEQRAELQAGEAEWFPGRAQQDTREDQSLSAAWSGQGEQKRSRTGSWRQHAEQGDFKRAFALLRQDKAEVAPEVAELMLAADAARLSGHPQEAVPYLRKVMEQHPDDPRAPLAAFTLGGVLMKQLGLPREAGAAYARARAGTRSAALAQDALARQVEAAHRAGDEALARQLAERYVREYPEGRRLRAVRRFGGLR